MDSMRSRAKEHLPHVLLTLLSIIQALALELFWSEVQTLDELFTLSWLALSTWIQVASTFLGILVIWVVYATTVMRFSWVPGISDSVVPFFVGLLQFVLIESLGVESAGSWFLSLAAIFAIMHGESHMIMRRARRDPDNVEFFRQIGRATIRDSISPSLMVISLLALGAYTLAAPNNLLVTGVGLLLSLLLLVWHIVFMTLFWKRTMGELVVPGAPEKEGEPD
ncbi:MAG: hypothetical protein EP301_03020 [Gammaproteobacteria bacterium]|nr:MAG: hypothetical protein EP301_03020 [Gammaproteobacteria bacterium]